MLANVNFVTTIASRSGRLESLLRLLGSSSRSLVSTLLRRLYFTRGEMRQGSDKICSQEVCDGRKA